MIYQDNTGLPKRFSGPSKDRNIVTSVAAQSTQININAYMGNGGERAVKDMLQNMLGTSRFDDVVSERACECNGTSCH